MWFLLRRDERITHRCATEDCGGQVTWKLEASGVGSFYCDGCKTKISVADVNEHLLNQNFRSD